MTDRKNTQPAPAQLRLRRFKEKLAERIWALTALTEPEKEIVFRTMLGDLDDFERDLTHAHDEASSAARASVEENDLLRSLLGVPGDELRTRILTLGEDIRGVRGELSRREEEVDEITKRNNELKDENEILRNRVKKFEEEADIFHAQQVRAREEDIRTYSETHEALRNQLKDLESRLSNLRELFSESNQKLLSEKQEEISLLQKKLLDEMEDTLRRRQQLNWAEEETFAKGIANKVRMALVSAQGQLMLTLERLGVLDPETKTEAFWKGRLRLLVEGAGEIAKNFREIQSLLQHVTSSLDDYLHLTRRRELAQVPISLPDLVKKEMASFYADRQPTMNFDVSVDNPVPDITGDPSLVSFIVRELIKNAVEALPNGTGQIFIRIESDTNTEVVRLIVKDSGKGISSDILEKLFQPFFTTKANRQGLSLSRAKRYAEFHGGDLELINTSPSGTVIQLALPIDGKKAA